MIEYPRLAFVSAPEPDAQVRLDLNTFGEVADEEMWPGHDGFSLGAPSFEGGPGAVGAEYGYRRASFGLVVKGAKYRTTETLSALGRELMRPGGNWLMFQLSPETPVAWLRTWQTAPTALSFEGLRNDDNGVARWGIEIALDADAWLYGERVTLPAVTINNDIDAATNPLVAQLPSIKGDAPTPLRIECSAPPAGKGQMLAVVAVDSGVPGASGYTTPRKIVSGWSLGTDTTVTSGVYRVSFATNTAMVTRVFDDTANVTGGGSTANLQTGRFRAFIRLAVTSTVGEFKVRMGQYGTSGVYVFGDTQTVSATGTAKAVWVDAGDFAFPFANPLNEVDAKTLTVQASDMVIQAQRSSGAGSLDIDSVLFVPVDLPAAPGSATTTALVERGDSYTGSATKVVFDAENERLLLSTSTQVVNMSTPAVIRGQLPVARPGAVNVLHFLRAMGADVLTDTTTLTISYRPRWMWLAAI